MAIHDQSTLHQGILALKAGDKARARTLLTHVVEADDANEQAWLWLAGAVDDPAEQQICLENVLHLDPQNVRAQQGLRWLQGQHPHLFTAAASTAMPTVPSQSSVPAATGPTIALESAAPVAPAPPQQGYYVPAADGTLHSTEALPCPRCGATTTLNQKRCPTCGLSLMIKVSRAIKPNRIGTTIAGIINGIYAVLVMVVGGLVLWAVQTLWSLLKASALQNVPKAQQASRLAQLDSAYDEAIAPLLLIGGVVLVIGIVLLTLAIKLVQRRPWAYWISLVLTTLFWITNGVGYIRTLRDTNFLITGGPTDRYVRLYLLGLTLGPLLLTISLLGLLASYRGFTRQRVRFRAIDAPSNDDKVHFNRGLAYQRQGLLYQAMLEWQRAVEANTSDATNHHALGMLYHQLKRPADALRELDAALALDPNDSRIAEDRQQIAVARARQPA